MSRLTFQERMLWAQLAAILAVGVYYVHFLAHAGPGHHYFHAVILAVLLVFGSISFAARHRTGAVVEDERDRSIAAIGARWSNLILWIGLVAILVMYWDHGKLHSQGFMVGIIFHLLVLAAAVRIIRELVAYRTAL